MLSFCWNLAGLVFQFCYEFDGFNSLDCWIFLIQILYQLYDQEVIQEEAILRWDDEKTYADESDKIFVKQAETFIHVSDT